MLKFLFPYGNTPFIILVNCAKKEFGENKVNANSYTKLQTEIKREINRLYKKTINEYYLKTLSEKEHHNQYHLVSYFSMKYSAHAVIISVLSLIISSYIPSLLPALAKIILVWLALTIIVSYRSVHIQQAQVEYLQFKLRCLEEIVKSKST